MRSNVFAWGVIGACGGSRQANEAKRVCVVSVWKGGAKVLPNHDLVTRDLV